MTNHGGEGSSSSDFHCVYVETNFDTRLALLIHNDENIFDFKEKLCNEHKKSFPEVGDINVSALKVKRRRQFFHLSDSMNMISKAFEGIRSNWFMYVDAVRVEKDKLLTIMDVDQHCSNPELLEKNKKEIGSGSVLVDGHSKDLILEESLKTGFKKTRKRNMESSDGKKSRKKPAIDLNQSDVATTGSRDAVDESHELSGQVLVDVVVSDILAGAIEKEIECGKKNDISMEENQQTSEADRVCQEKVLTANPELVDGITGGEANDAQANQTLKGALETELAMGKSNGSDESHKSCGEVQIEKLDDLRGEIEQDLEKGEKTAEIVKINQEKDLVPTLDTSRDDVNESHEKLDGLLSGAIEKDNGRCEGSRLAPSAAANLQTAELVTYPENELEASSNLTTSTAAEKKKKRKKISKDHIDQSATAATTISEDIVNVDPISRSETLGNPRVEAIQKENEMGEKSIEDVGRDKIETDNLENHPANNLDANSGLITSPVTEKKKKRKKSSKAQSSAATTTTSKETVYEMSGVAGNIDNLSNPFAEAREKENEMGEKIDDGAGSGKAIPSVADTIQTNSYLENQLEANSGLKSGIATEKKRKQKKSSKDQSTTATTISREFVNKTEKVSGSIDRVDATSFPNSRGEKLVDTFVDAIQNENEMGNVGPTDNLQVAELASTPVQELKTLDQIGKFTDGNRTHEHEVAKDNGEIYAGEAESVKSTKKKKSIKAKTPAKEDTSKTPAKKDTLVVSSAQNVKPSINVVDEEEPDNVIRNVLDSLRAEENPAKIGKKTSKKSKKKDSLNVVEAHVLSVEGNNTAQKEVPLINNPKETDASFTPAKKDNEGLKKRIKVADNTVTNSPSKQIQVEKADMEDNFGSSQKRDDIVGGGKKQEQVTSGVKSKKEKKNLVLHPSGSIDGSMSSMKPKARKAILQPASSGTSHLQPRVKNDSSGTKVDRSNASVKVAVKNKKEAVKKSSNPVTVNKSTMNFFKDAEWDSTDDESNKPASDVFTKSPSDSSSDDDSDVTSMSRRQGNNLTEGTNKLSGSLRDILRSSRSYKEAKLRASQSQPDIYNDESPPLDCVPDSQVN